MNRVIRWFLLFLGVFLFPGILKAGNTVGDHFSLPPAMEKLFGNPRVHVLAKRSGPASSRLIGFGNYNGFHGFRPRLHRSRILVSGDLNTSQESLSQLLARPLLQTFHNEVLDLESRTKFCQSLLMAELFPVSESEFLTLGSKVLTSGSSGVSWFDNWWKVRMGLPLTRSRDHHLLLINLQMDDPGFQSSTGHFCLGLRKNQGDPANDVVIEFRAPWYLDRIPTLREGMNFEDTLPLQAYPENLYDWLHTQTELRNNNARIRFLPIAEEQVTLFEDFLVRERVHDAGQYRPLRGNCASLGLIFAHRLQPIDTPLLLGKGLADLPFRCTDRLLKQYREREGRSEPFAMFSLDSVTRDKGREPTAKSFIHPAVPSRKQSRAFQELLSWENMNLNKSR